MLSAGSHVTAGLATTPVVVVVAVVAGVAPILGAVTVNATEDISVSVGVSPPSGNCRLPLSSNVPTADIKPFSEKFVKPFLPLKIYTHTLAPCKSAIESTLFSKSLESWQPYPSSPVVQLYVLFNALPQVKLTVSPGLDFPYHCAAGPASHSQLSDVCSVVTSVYILT